MSTLATSKEWVLCLVSKEHAKKTWLRIDPEDERAIFRYLYIAIMILLIASVVMLVVGIRKYQDINREHQQLQILIQQLKQERGSNDGYY